MAQNTISVQREIPIVGNYDVVVCGGGPAGFIAAIAAARSGVKTALIEQYGFLGGMATTSFVAPLSVFTYNNELVVGGIPWEFVQNLVKMEGGYIEKPLGNIAFDPEKYKLCCQRMVMEAGVDLYMHSYISGCTKKGNTIEQIIFENKNGSEALNSHIFIDTTGDADVAYMANAPMLSYGDAPLQPASSYFILGGVDTKSEMISKAMHHNMQGVNCQCEPMRKKLFELSKTQDIPTWGGPWFCTTLHEGCIAINITRTSTNACDNRDFTRAEFQLREDAFKLTEILRENFEEFKNCYILAVATHAGIRETRHVKGMHIITTDEYVNGYHYEDSVSRGAHPIDIHSNQAGNQGCTFLKQPAYVPYRALITEEISNLLVAGRCLSAYQEAFASLRVQASCMGMGQAAGAAAAQCAKNHTCVQQANVVELIAQLKQWGATL